MSLTAYHKAQATVDDPRAAEYRLFGQVTRELVEAVREPGPHKARLFEAIHWNRRLWSALAADCVNDDNKLPQVVRAQIISLSIWVTRHSSMVARDEAAVEPLIDINRTIMQGLAGQPG